MADVDKSPRAGALCPFVADGPQGTLDELITKLEAIRVYATDLEARRTSHIANVHRDYHLSARNLLHYLALRHFDIRNLQEALSALGLSSLGRTESHTMASINAVAAALQRLRGGDPGTTPPPSVPDFKTGRERLAANTEALLGPEPPGRGVRIMVTLPTEAGDDPELVRDLLARGMNCVRINCAHDTPEIWAKMIANVHSAKRELERECRVFMDLAGPKLRTGLLEPGPKVIRWRPRRDARGRVTAPARIWLAPEGERPPAGITADATVPVEERWLRAARPGDRVRLVDARGKARTFQIVGEEDAARWAESRQSTYLETGMALMLEPGTEAGEGRRQETGIVGDLPPTEQPILLKRGDTLILHKHRGLGAPAAYDRLGGLRRPAHVSCTLPLVFADARIGEPIAFDDGKIEGVIRAASAEEIRVEITHARPRGTKLRADKSINLPETRLHSVGLTEKDQADLEFAVRHADAVCLSFVNNPADVLALQEALQRHRADHVGLVLKIETRRGFDQLPWLLIAGMRSYPIGVVIARGDLAVECGWECLAEIQEEMLWLCEAAHIPVIWATQVLEQLAKRGLPSRAEITDAAMGERAECVMLNKGPHIRRALRALDDILRRMQAHQVKKTAMLSSLKLSDAMTITGEYRVQAP